jgi:hypothetical protein
MTEEERGESHGTAYEMRGDLRSMDDEDCRELRGTTEEEPWEPMHYGHPRMPLEERAKIFMPFDPLRGFREELRRREGRQHEP